MKNYLSFIVALLFLALNASASEKIVEPAIKSVTVFFDGAQIFSEAKVSLPAGKSKVIFTGLSTYIDKNSIQVSGQGEFTILSVKHSFNYLDKQGESNDQIINNKIKDLKIQLETKETELNILKQSKDFLLSNKTVVNSDKAIEPNNLKLYSEFFETKFEEIELKILKKQREIKDLTEKLKSYEQQAQATASKMNLPISEVAVEVKTDVETIGIFKLNYLISNAGWYPTYDLRVTDINHPVHLTYQANVHQNSGIDWNNIELTFSNANPSDVATIPNYFPYYLDFSHSFIPQSNYSYNPNIREVKGIILDADTKEPLPFVNITVKDKSVGTASDFNGRFSLGIPEGGQFLQISYVGYQPLQVPISQDYLTIHLEASVQSLEAFEILDYNVPRIKNKETKSVRETIPLDMIAKSNQTYFEFKIDIPYTLESNSNPLKIDMNDIELNTDYIYKSIPKFSEKAYLIALISNWAHFNLLDGEVNIYFENTYVGKSLLDLSLMSDTLEVSLGSDNNISVKRELQEEYASRQFIGGNKIEKRSWKISIKNNKSQKIKLTLYDQVPVSQNQEITVDINNISAGEIEDETGKITWEIDIDPGETISKVIEYSVKYPRNKRLAIQ